MLRVRSASQILLVSLAAMAAPVVALAVPPIQAYTVPWIATSSATPHYSWNGKAITLKGTANVQDTGSGNIKYDWNPGDGGTHCTGTVTNQFIIECPYTYSGASISTVFNATLTVFDASTSNGGSPPVYSNSSSASYYTQIYNPPPSLQTETNAAIDAGLWYLHKGMTRYSSATVASIALTNGGSGYEANGSTAPVVSFSGCSSSPTATAVVDNGGPVTSGIITSLTLNSPGAGCTSPVTVTITDPLGNVSNAVTSVTLTNGGQDFNLLYGSYPYYNNAEFFVAGHQAAAVLAIPVPSPLPLSTNIAVYRLRIIITNSPPIPVTLVIQGRKPVALELRPRRLSRVPAAQGRPRQ